jgi:(2Fe-2S) ferredoxin
MDQSTRYRAYLCCGPRCTLRRSNPLVDVLAREVARAGLGDRVQVLPGGCMKHCESGPTLTVWPGPVYYEGVTAERLRVIVAQHFGQDAPVEEYFWHDPFENARERARAWLRDREIARAAAAGPAPPPPAPALSRAQPPPKKRKPPRPSWRSSEGEVDDFKW